MTSSPRRRRSGIRGMISVAWRVKAGWQVERFNNYVPNVVIFWVMTGRRRWYFIRAYVPPNDDPTVVRV